MILTTEAAINTDTLIDELYHLNKRMDTRREQIASESDKELLDIAAHSLKQMEHRRKVLLGLLRDAIGRE